MRVRIENIDEEKLDIISEKIAKCLFKGAFIALYGDLGSGKTTFTYHVAKHLGIDDVQSPTFTIVREHKGDMELFHFDAYRLSSSDELYDIGYDDYMNRGGIIFMEWCELVSDAIPEDRLEVHIYGSGDMNRLMEFVSFGKKYDEMLLNSEVDKL